MSTAAQHIIESTITAILLFWVITHAGEFTTVVTATRQAVVGSVNALRGA